MSVLVMAAVVVVVDIHDGALTVGMSVLVIMAAAVDMHDGFVDTVDCCRVCFENGMASLLEKVLSQLTQNMMTNYRR